MEDAMEEALLNFIQTHGKSIVMNSIQNQVNCDVSKSIDCTNPVTTSSATEITSMMEIPSDPVNGVTETKRRRKRSRKGRKKMGRRRKKGKGRRRR